MKQGDFSQLARNYKYRSAYSIELLKMLVSHIGKNDMIVADVGAGTGKLTAQLNQLQLKGYAVEPNDAMRNEGIRNEDVTHFEWLKGSAEHTGLADNSVDWVTMASSFHWTDHEQALNEFHRILKPGGYLTVMWNPRNLNRSPLEQKIENMISTVVPELKRVSSGANKYTEDLEDILLRSGQFSDLLFIEAMHDTVMSKDRYIGIWKSVNDVRAQAGEDRFKIILDNIYREVESLDQVVVPYKTRAWTVKSMK